MKIFIFIFFAVFGQVQANDLVNEYLWDAPYLEQHSQTELKAKTFENPYVAESETPHQLHIIEDGLTSLELRLQMVAAAKKHIYFETFILDLDEGQRLFLQMLAQKAREGVEVKVLIDHTPVYFFLAENYAQMLEESGVEVRYHNHTSWIKALKIQYRNHKKTLSIDNKWAIIGGRNHGDSYFNMSDFYNYLDRDVLIQGEVVGAIDQTFLDFWEHEFTSNPRYKILDKIKKYKKKLEDRGGAVASLIKKIEKLTKKMADFLLPAKKFLETTEEDIELRKRIRKETKLAMTEIPLSYCQKSVFVSDTAGRRGKKDRIAYKELMKRIKSAEVSVLMDTPYFVVQKEDVKILEQQLQDGIDMTAFVNSYAFVSDSFLTLNYFNFKAPFWARRGFEFFVTTGKNPDHHIIMEDEYRKARWGNHAKSFIVDDKVSIIGSYNFDPRSKLYSAESFLACDEGPETVAQLKTLIERKMQDGLPTDERGRPEGGYLKGLGFFAKVLYHLQTLPSILLKPFI